METCLREVHRTADLVRAGEGSIGTRAMAERVLDALAAEPAVEP